MRIKHQFEPIYDTNSKILILGTLPSIKSREEGFYYGHPRNRFWNTLSRIYNSSELTSIDDKISFCLDNNIAIWDVVAECDIDASADSSIKNVIANDLSLILDNANIVKIFTNGKKADELYYKYLYPIYKRDTICLPSTSPANARWSDNQIFEYWSEVLSKF